MTFFFPLTKPLNDDASIIIQALNRRSNQIKTFSDSQGILKKIGVAAIKILGLASAITAAASLPAAFISSVTLPLTIGVGALITAIACLALSIYYDTKSPSEMIVKDLWKRVFESLREGDGKKIVLAAHELAIQKEQRASAFNDCIGNMDPNDTAPFLHKTLFLGNLQQALDYLQLHQEEQAKTHALAAISHFSSSGLDSDIELFVRAIAESPEKILPIVELRQINSPLHVLDTLIIAWRNI